MLNENVNLTGKTVLVTGAAGFISANLTMALLQNVKTVTVVGLDSVNDYYDVSLKEYRLRRIEETARENTSAQWIFVKGNLADKELLEGLFAQYRFDLVVNLAAQAGVRYSSDHPDVYTESNVIGFYNVLEACRCLLTGCTTLATANRKICWISWIFCNRSWLQPGFCPQILILRRIKSWFPCSPAMFP